MVLYQKTVTVATATTLDATTAEPNLPKVSLPNTGHLVGVEVASVAGTSNPPVYCEPTLFYTDLAGILLNHGWIRNGGAFNDDCVFWTGQLPLAGSIFPSGPYLLARMRNDTGSSVTVVINVLVDPE